ncbi:hypothetical protein P9112_002286 [Eukaryota sp. TZLM1-RC]
MVDAESLDLLYMQYALNVANNAMHSSEVPVGAVIVHNSSIVATGANRTNETKNATRHAELEAIDTILCTYPSIKFSECDLYVTLEPCIMCADALRRLNFHSVIFGAWNDKFGGCGSVLNILDNARGGLLKDEAIELLREFYSTGNANCPTEKRKRAI